eukprot:m.99335 g.99335  ORF g.99335 m.99335 type:complete len:177 (+) comp37065_c0_seq1:2854-3384(+)
MKAAQKLEIEFLLVLDRDVLWKSSKEPKQLTNEDVETLFDEKSRFGKLIKEIVAWDKAEDIKRAMQNAREARETIEDILDDFCQYIAEHHNIWIWSVGALEAAVFCSQSTRDLVKGWHNCKSDHSEEPCSGCSQWLHKKWSKLILDKIDELAEAICNDEGSPVRKFLEYSLKKLSS